VFSTGLICFYNCVRIQILFRMNLNSEEGGIMLNDPHNVKQEGDNIKQGIILNRPLNVKHLNVKQIIG